MAGWLARLGRPVPGGHADHPAYGMASLEEMNRLRAARGAAFDRLFLSLMIRHHQGAMTMAAEQLAGGRDLLMRLVAKDVHVGQGIEVSRMRLLLSK